MAPRLFAIVLAAGRAERFGAIKQLQEYSGQALVVRAVRNAETLFGERTVLVTGNAGTDVHAACAPLDGFLVHNSEFTMGMASSIASGVAAVAHCADAVMILLADQPLIGTRQLTALRDKWLENPQLAAASSYEGRSAVPAIFPQQDFAALMALQGDQGARSILQPYGDNLPTIDMPEAAIDIDRPEDLRRLPTDDA